MKTVYILYAVMVLSLVSAIALAISKKKELNLKNQSGTEKAYYILLYIFFLSLGLWLGRMWGRKN